jgi:uncharacterized protein (DUF983 family)
VSTHTIRSGIQRGPIREYPPRGQGKLIRGFLKVRPRCSVRATNDGVHPPDTLPPNATIVTVGHVAVPPLFRFGRAFTPPLSIRFATWLSLTAFSTIGLPPFVKGRIIGLYRATGTVRPDAS